MIEMEQANDSNKPPFHKIPLDQQYKEIQKYIKEIVDELKQKQIQQIEVTANQSFRSAINGPSDPVPGNKLTNGKNSANQANPQNENTGEGAPTLLNGAQIASALEIIEQLSSGQIPRDSAKQMLIEFLGIDPETAERILSNIGKGFKSKVNNGKPEPVQ